uniref:Putative chaperone n=1 Tax=viral metagenome TaxID=1070528 RepID=A0A6M3M824_9ZZZZ
MGEKIDALVREAEELDEDKEPPICEECGGVGFRRPMYGDGSSYTCDTCGGDGIHPAWSMIPRLLAVVKAMRGECEAEMMDPCGTFENHAMSASILASGEAAAGGGSDGT